jgi:hypothetical protein
MRILPLAVIALAVLAGCSSTQRSAAPAPAAQPMAASGSMDTTPQGDSIDRFAAAYEASHQMRRY